MWRPGTSWKTLGHQVQCEARVCGHSGTRLAGQYSTLRVLGLQVGAHCRGQHMHTEGPGGVAPPLRKVSLQGSAECSSEVQCDQTGWTAQHTHMRRTLGLHGSGRTVCGRSACRVSALKDGHPPQAYRRGLTATWNKGLVGRLAAQRPACRCTRSTPGLQSGSHSAP